MRTRVPQRAGFGQRQVPQQREGKQEGRVGLDDRGLRPAPDHRRARHRFGARSPVPRLVLPARRPVSSRPAAYGRGDPCRTVLESVQAAASYTWAVARRVMNRLAHLITGNKVYLVGFDPLTFTCDPFGTGLLHGSALCVVTEDLSLKFVSDVACCDSTLNLRA